MAARATRSFALSLILPNEPIFRQIGVRVKGIVGAATGGMLRAMAQNGAPRFAL